MKKDNDTSIINAITIIISFILLSTTFGLVNDKLTGDNFQYILVGVVGTTIGGLLGFLGGREYGTKTVKDLEIENGRLDYHSVKKEND